MPPGRSPRRRGGGVAGPCRGLAGTPEDIPRSRAVDRLHGSRPAGRRMRTLQFSRLELIRAWTQQNRQYTTVAAGPQPGDLCSSLRGFPQRTRHPGGLKHSAHSAHCRRRIRRRLKSGGGCSKALSEPCGDAGAPFHAVRQTPDGCGRADR